MSYPKMTLRVKLSKDKNRVDFHLIQVTDIYCNSGTLLDSGKSMTTWNNWLFYVGLSFQIIPGQLMFVVPKRPNKDKDFMIFDSENERYHFLKSLHTALLDWSNNHMFKGKNIFKNKPEIKFHDDIWVIF